MLLLLPFLFFLVSTKIYWICHLFLLVVIILEEKAIGQNKSRLHFLLAIPLFWAFFFSFQDHLYFVTQSLFYLTTPILFTFLGIKISRVADQKMVFEYIIYSGTIGAFCYLAISFYNFGLNAFVDPYSIRNFFHWGSIASVIALIIVLYSEKFGVILIRNKAFKYFIVGVNLLALYFTASRTYYIAFLIFILVFLYNTNKKKLFFALVFGVLFGSFFLTLFSDNILLDKFKSISTEISVGNYQTDEEINTKYRGYETNMALETYMSGTELNLLFGHGFEKQVDLKTEVLLGDTYRSVIPVLHNGYIYILIKIGFLGLIFYFVFFIKLFRLKYNIKEFMFFRIITLGSIISLLFSNFVIGTFFTMEMSVIWILFGIYIGYIEMSKRKVNAFKL